MPPLPNLHYPGYTFMFRAELMRRGLPIRREMKEILFVLATDDKGMGTQQKSPMWFLAIQTMWG